MPNQQLMDEAYACNVALDNALRLSGAVDRDLYLRFREAYGYQAASTVGWVEARLRVLLARVDGGLPASLFSPAMDDLVCVDTKAALEQWAESNFPGVLE